MYKILNLTEAEDFIYHLGFVYANPHIQPYNTFTSIMEAEYTIHRYVRWNNSVEKRPRLVKEQFDIVEVLPDAHSNPLTP